MPAAASENTPCKFDPNKPGEPQMQRVARSRWPNCRGADGATKACFGRQTKTPEGTAEMYPARERQLWRKQQSGWNRRADGKAFRSPTTRLTGPIAGFIVGRGFAGPDGRKALNDRPG